MRTTTTSYTEMSKLAECERKWWYSYVVGVRGEQTVQQRRGSDLHEVIAEWWDRQDRSMPDLMAEHTWISEDGEARETVVWLLNRYEEHHGQSRADGVLRMIGHELYFQGLVPGTNTILRAYVDGLGLDAEGGLWLIERKSMKDWRRLALLDVDRQTALYDWIVKLTGLPLQGVIYDAIRTYRWKPEVPTLAVLTAEVLADNPGVTLTKKAAAQVAGFLQANHPGVDRPAGESFYNDWLTRTPAQHAAALADVQAGLQRRGALAAGAPPMRNLGQACDWCDHKVDCWDSLTFGRAVPTD